MKHTFILVRALIVAATVVILGGTVPAYAAPLGFGSIQSGAQQARGVGQPESLFGDGGVMATVINTLLFLAGALAVIMVIYGGLRYVTSGGNEKSVTAAKNTIMYALVGLIIAFLAYAFISWLIGTIGQGGNSGFTNI